MIFLFLPCLRLLLFLFISSLSQPCEKYKSCRSAHADQMVTLKDKTTLQANTRPLPCHNDLPRSLPLFTSQSLGYLQPPSACCLTLRRFVSSYTPSALTNMRSQSIMHQRPPLLHM